MTPICRARFSCLALPPAARPAARVLAVVVLSGVLAPSAFAQAPVDVPPADTAAVRPATRPHPDSTAASPPGDAGALAADPLFGAKPEMFGAEWTSAFGPPVVYPDSVAAASDPVGTRPDLAPPPRLTLVSRSRPVVLLPGVSRSPSARPPGAGRDDRQASPITRATVQVGPDGERTVVYSDRAAAPPDVSLAMGCGPAADRSLARIRSLAETPLLITDEGPLVGAAQQLLCVAGYPVPQTSVFDDEMEVAVTDFQSAHNAAAPPENQLLVSGVLDEPTRRQLAAMVLARLGERD